MLAEIGQAISFDIDDGRHFACLRIQEHFFFGKVKKNRIFYISPEKQLVELSPILGSSTRAVVVEVFQLEALEKLKVSQSIILSLIFRSNKIVVYEMVSTTDCVNCIKYEMSLLNNESVLTKTTSTKKSPTKSHINNNDNNINSNSNIELMDSYLKVVKSLEAEFTLMPSMDLINNMMNLLQQSVEISTGPLMSPSEKSKHTYTQLVTHIQKFLQRDDVIKVLNDQLHQQQQQPVNNNNDNNNSSTSAEKNSLEDTSIHINTSNKHKKYDNLNDVHVVQSSTIGDHTNIGNQIRTNNTQDIQRIHSEIIQDKELHTAMIIDVLFPQHKNWLNNSDMLLAFIGDELPECTPEYTGHTDDHTSLTNDDESRASLTEYTTRPLSMKPNITISHLHNNGIDVSKSTGSHDEDNDGSEYIPDTARTTDSMYELKEEVQLIMSQVSSPPPPLLPLSIHIPEHTTETAITSSHLTIPSTVTNMQYNTSTSHPILPLYPPSHEPIDDMHSPISPSIHRPNTIITTTSTDDVEEEEEDLEMIFDEMEKELEYITSAFSTTITTDSSNKHDLTISPNHSINHPIHSKLSS